MLVVAKRERERRGEVCVFGKASSGCQATKNTANQSAVRYDVRERGGVERVRKQF